MHACARLAQVHRRAAGWLLFSACYVCIRCTPLLRRQRPPLRSEPRPPAPLPWRRKRSTARAGSPRQRAQRAQHAERAACAQRTYAVRVLHSPLRGLVHLLRPVLRHGGRAKDFWYGGSELLPQGRCGRHLPPSVCFCLLPQAAGHCLGSVLLRTVAFKRVGGGRRWAVRENRWRSPAAPRASAQPNTKRAPRARSIPASVLLRATPTHQRPPPGQAGRAAHSSGLPAPPLQITSPASSVVYSLRCRTDKGGLPAPFHSQPRSPPLQNIPLPPFNCCSRFLLSTSRPHPPLQTLETRTSNNTHSRAVSPGGGPIQCNCQPARTLAPQPGVLWWKILELQNR